MFVPENHTNMIAIAYMRWLPAFSWQTGLLIVGACLLIWVIVRACWGKRLVNPSATLMVLRSCFLVVLILILMGPTVVDEVPGKSNRPKMIYLLDGSQSMRLGAVRSRWESAQMFLKEADESSTDQAGSDTQWFRFGHRLEPMSNANSTSANDLNPVSTPPKALGPDATDSRLGIALRQLLSQVDSESTAGVVVLSDGRVRDTDTVEALGKTFLQSKVPIHVVPLGDSDGNGDIAIVSLVIPPSVRKFTDNEIQVFVRSFGLNGKGTNVKLVRPSTDGTSESTTISSVPVTLAGGPQSVTLPFRAQDRSEELIVTVDSIPGELTLRNNEVRTKIEIDRTSVRVLYLQDVAAQPRGSQISLQRRLALIESSASAEPFTAVRDALQFDDDIRCIVLTSANNMLPENPLTETLTSSFTFPKTRGELFAFDCIIISDMSPVFLNEQHCIWLREWVNERGGGLIVTGAKALAGEVWQDLGLAELLPAVLPQRAETAGDAAVQIDQPNHPIFQIRLVDSLNRQILKTMPALSIAQNGIQSKLNAEVLATSNGMPVLITHRSGRGRVLLSTANLTSEAFRKLSTEWGGQDAQVAAKFWRNMVYWATEGSATGRRRLIATPDKRFYRPGDQLSIYASAYDEGAKETSGYEVWAMFEPSSLDDDSLYAPIMWPENVIRESGETSPRIAWGEEIKLDKSSGGNGYLTKLGLSETSDDGDKRLRIELTAYEAEEGEDQLGHGSQVDSTSVAIQILSDPFEQQNPLPNHQFLEQLAAISDGKVLRSPSQLTDLLNQRSVKTEQATQEYSPSWSRSWIWICMLGLLSAEWLLRRLKGLA